MVSVSVFLKILSNAPGNIGTPFTVYGVVVLFHGGISTADKTSTRKFSQTGKLLFSDSPRLDPMGKTPPYIEGTAPPTGPIKT